MEKNYTPVVQASQVTEEILQLIYDIVDGWYPTGRIDWKDLLDRVDGAELEDGTVLGLGDDMLSPAIVKIKKHVRGYRRS
jgi:hypothetical protein